MLCQVQDSSSWICSNEPYPYSLCVNPPILYAAFGGSRLFASVPKIPLSTTREKEKSFLYINIGSIRREGHHHFVFTSICLRDLANLALPSRATLQQRQTRERVSK